MKTLIRIVSLVLLVMVAPMAVIASNPPSKTTTVKKVPKNPKDYGKDGIRTPSRDIVCVMDMENGIQPIDTSDIESYEVWDSNDNTMIASFGDEFEFISYILGDHPQCIIKLCASDYMYVGYLY